MRVLLDNNVNARFGKLLTGHEIVHVQDIGWDKIQNGALLRLAETDGFDVIVTADKSMRYQQNLRDRRLSIVVLNSLFIKLDSIAPLAPHVQALLDQGFDAGSFIVVEPHPKA